MEPTKMTPVVTSGLDKLEALERSLSSQADSYGEHMHHYELGSEMWSFYRGKRDAFRLAATHLHETLREL